MARGPYDVENIDKHDLTGSESFFFNMAKELARQGHGVTAFGYWKEDIQPQAGLFYKKFEVFSTEGSLKTLLVHTDLRQFDVAVAWNEPDYLVPFPETTKTICVQQLNDFSYCRSDFETHTDLFLFPSEVHREHMLRTDTRLKADKCKVLSNCINSKQHIDALNGNVYHANKRMVYCSSPDRGLHWIAELFQHIQKRVPDVTLDVYYRYQSWYDNFKDAFDTKNPLYYELGLRARYIQEFFNRYGTDGSKGVTLHGQVPSAVVAEALVSSRMLFYPCDTVLFTEGFGVSVLDALYAGAVPVISDCDAFGSVYTGAAEVIPGRVRDNRGKWVQRVTQVLTDDDYHHKAAIRGRAFAEQFTPVLVCEKLLGHIAALA